MYTDFKWLRLTPDRPGRGGTKTGVHTFQQEPMNDIRSLSGAHVYQGTWRRDFATIEYPLPQFSLGLTPTPLALHGYVYPSLIDPSAAPSVTILSHYRRGAPAPQFTYVMDVGTGVNRLSNRGQSASPGIFQNIAGRCFFADGVGEGYIFDDRTPAIHAQANQPLGIGTPQQAMTPGNFGTGLGFSPEGTGFVTQQGVAGVSYLNHPNPANKISEILTTDTILFDKIDPNYAIYSLALTGPISPSVNGVSSNTTPFTATGTISITSGTQLVTLAGATWPARFKYAGLAINFNGYSFILTATGDGLSNAYDIDGVSHVLTNVQAYILGIYDGPTVTGIPYTITGSQVTFASAVSTLNTITFSGPGATGYSQSTHSNLVQVKLSATRASGFSRNLGNVSLGPAGGGTRTTVTDGAELAGSTQLTSASAPWTVADVGSTIIVDGAGVTGGMVITYIVTFFSPSFVLVGSNNASGGNITNKRVWWGKGFISITDATMGAGSTTVTSASNPWVVGDVGKTIMIEKAGVAGAALYTSITAFVGAGNVTVANASTGAVAAVQASFGGGTSNATTGPTYAYAWYDPETGHCSNISPLYQVQKPTEFGNYTDFANLTPVFQIDPGMIAYPSGLPGSAGNDANRFSHIIFFRTLSAPGSSTLYPIGSLQPFVGKVHPGSASTLGSWNPMLLNGWYGLPNSYVPMAGNVPAPLIPTPPNYWYDFSTDSDLLLSGGFRAPQFTNEKPMVLLRGGITQPGNPIHMAYWDRRLWIVNTQEPDKIAFSCDEAQCPLGVPEESFPPTNFLRLPSVDGQVMGMRNVGEMLLITTQKLAYIVAGNNESNYRLMKVSSSMPGVGTYQMDEFPTFAGAEGEPTTLFYLGRDRVVYRWTIGGAVVPVSQPIQNQLDNLLSGNSGGSQTQLLQYKNTRVHCVSAWGRRLVIVALDSTVGGTRTSPIHTYDIDNGIWSENYHTNGIGDNIVGTAPMTSIYGLSTPVNELFSIYDPSVPGIIVRSWLRDDVPVAAQTIMDLLTFPLNFDGKKTRKQIVAVNLHATGSPWVLSIYVNESSIPVVAGFGSYPDPLESIYPQFGPAPADPGATDIVVMGAQLTGAPVVGYRFVFDIQKLADITTAQVFAIDIAFRDYAEANEGDP